MNFKDFLIHSAISTILALLTGLDKNGSALAKWRPYLVEIRDAVNELLPPDAI